MMNSTTHDDDELIQSLELISAQLNRYLSPIIFLFGVGGNILNCLVLSHRTLRSNPCALLFLVSSFIDLVSILIGLPTRILAGWGLDPTTTNAAICRFRAFVVFSTRTMATWLITLATIDRWFLSSVDTHRRRFSTLKNAQSTIILTVILSSLFYTHMAFCYDANLTDGPLRCYGKTQTCRFVTDMIYALIANAIPIVLMSIFGLMTISNVHHVHVRVQHATSISMRTSSRSKDMKYRKIDHQLLRMLLVQIFLLMLLCIPQVIQKFHLTFRPFGTVSKLDDAIRTFLYNITLLLAFIASGMPFYIYTLAGGTIFRKKFLDLIRHFIARFT